MKKIVAIVVVMAFSFALAGCAAGAPASSSASGSATSASASSESASASATVAEPILWTKTNDPRLAAREAGLDGFECPTEAKELSVGKIEDDWSYCYTEGMAEGDSHVGEASIIVRKSKATGDNTAELSETTENWPDLKDLTYANQWDIKVGDTDVHCFSNKKDVASKMIWDQNGYGYSVLALGQGDTWADFGLNESDTKILVEATIKANADYKEADKIPEPSSSASASSKSANYDKVVANAVANYGLGELASYNTYKDVDGNTMIEVVTRDVDGYEYTSTLDTNGNLIESGYDQMYYEEDPEGYEDEEEVDDAELEEDETTDESEDEATDESEDENVDESADEVADEYMDASADESTEEYVDESATE